jgi:hypothetical protein
MRDAPDMHGYATYVIVNAAKFKVTSGRNHERDDLLRHGACVEPEAAFFRKAHFS